MEALMKNIKQDIKNGKMKKVYLVYGEEEYLKKNIKRWIFLKTGRNLKIEGYK